MTQHNTMVEAQKEPIFEQRASPLAAGATLIPVPVDHEGLNVETGRQLCPHARLAVVTTSHQLPACVTMSLSPLERDGWLFGFGGARRTPHARESTH